MLLEVLNQPPLEGYLFAANTITEMRVISCLLFSGMLFNKDKVLALLREYSSETHSAASESD